MLLRTWRAAELLVNMPKYNIEVDMKEMALIITWTKSNFKSTYSQYRDF